jgi:hypothetical protein
MTIEPQYNAQLEISRVFQYFKNLTGEMYDKNDKLHEYVDELQLKIEYLENNHLMLHDYLMDLAAQILKAGIPIFKPSIPSSASSAHTERPPRPDLDGNPAPLSLGTEMRQPRDLCSREMGDHHIPCTSRCKSCGSSLSILNRVHISSRQTNTLRVAFARLLSRIQEKVLELPGSLALSSALSPIESDLSSTLSLVCHGELYEDRICIQFRDENHPERVHSELVLHLNFHSS